MSSQREGQNRTGGDTIETKEFYTALLEIEKAISDLKSNQGQYFTELERRLMTSIGELSLSLRDHETRLARAENDCDDLGDVLEDVDDRLDTLEKVNNIWNGFNSLIAAILTAIIARQ